MQIFLGTICVFMLIYGILAFFSSGDDTNHYDGHGDL
jgi:hypothetical protein